VLPVEKIDSPINESFLNRGQFRQAGQFGTLGNKAARNAHEDFTFPLMPHESEDLIWETWIPLEAEATYLELQIWYPDSLIKPDQQDIGYLYQLKLNREGDTKVDGLITAELEVKALNRSTALTLEVAE
ncbi:hypothetical protein GIV89_17330, partial [Pseudomonas syringae]|nr:hypothetical protein [Pseudomonas syringae]